MKIEKWKIKRIKVWKTRQLADRERLSSTVSTITRIGRKSLTSLRSSKLLDSSSNTKTAKPRQKILPKCSVPSKVLRQKRSSRPLPSEPCQKQFILPPISATSASLSTITPTSLPLSAVTRTL